MPQMTGSRSTLEGYKRMMEEAASGVQRMEAHLKELVLATKMAQARVYQDEHRIIPAEQDELLIAGVETPCLRFTVVQGEAWKAERMAFNTSDANVIAFYCYRDTAIPSRLAEVAQAFTGSSLGKVYSDSFSNRLYLPERTQLYVVAVTATAFSTTVFDGNIQVEVLKRYQHPITQEEAYVRAGELSSYERAEDERWDDAAQEPHDERHGANELEDEGFGGDIEPPTPVQENLRPQPHFPERVIQAVEHVVEEVL